MTIFDPLGLIADSWDYASDASSIGGYLLVPITVAAHVIVALLILMAVAYLMAEFAKGLRTGWDRGRKD